ncbi:hypothetical protein ACFQ1R_00025 [Mariniflexile jejuense]|uniref:Uncharacterized protein n=1 Tax=Mariniflexile jejuense TaxID=1173582 RepID=A0ABW3JEF3_9FLAO
MGKKKYSLKQKIIYSTFIAGIMASGFLFDSVKEKNKSEKINSGNFKVYGIVEKLKPYSASGKGIRDRKDVVYLYYEKNDTVFHLIKDIPDKQINNLGIEINDCYLIRIAESDKDVFEIDFAKKVDTIIDKNDFEHQIYQTDIHKNIIE